MQQCITRAGNRPPATVTFCAVDLHKRRQLPPAAAAGVRSTMKPTIGLIALLLCMIANHSYACSKAAKIDEMQSIIYSVCPNFPELPNDSASKLVKNLLSQYTGPPDEIMIYFLVSKDSVGKVQPSEGELLGLYYTHDRNIVVWPNTKQEKIVKPIWLK